MSVSVSQQLARRSRHFLHAGHNPKRANAAQAPAPLGANLRFDPFHAYRRILQFRKRTDPKLDATMASCSGAGDQGACLVVLDLFPPQSSQYAP
jgi:hypothetical protein